MKCQKLALTLPQGQQGKLHFLFNDDFIEL